MKRRAVTNPRTATILTEFVVCCVLMAGVAATLVPLTNQVLRLNDHSRFESLALIEIANVQQKLKSGQPIDEIRMSVWMQQRYSDAGLSLVAEPNDESRCQITVSRPVPGYAKSRDVSVTYWRSETSQ